MASVEVKVPDIGDFKDVAVIEVLVQPGDTIKPEQSLVTVESDKASMEIPSSHGGVVKELKVKLGDKVSEGAVLLVVRDERRGRGATPAAPASPPGRAGSAAAGTRAAPPAAADVPAPAAPEAGGRSGPDRGPRPRHRRLQGRRRHRVAGQAGRHGRRSSSR